MTRSTSTRWPTSSVGSIDSEGIWYGLTTKAWIRSARPIASATITTSSTKRPAPRCRLRDQRCSNPRPCASASSDPRTPRRPSSDLLGCLGPGRSLLVGASRRPPRLPALLCSLAPPPSASSSSASSTSGIAPPRSGRRPRSRPPRPPRLGDHQVVLDPPAPLGDPGALADPAAQVVELGPADVAAGDDLEPLDLRRVDREGPLDADPERLLADREGLAGAGAAAGDHDALEDLGAPPACPRRPGSGRAPGRPRANRGTRFSWRCSMLSMIVLMVSVRARSASPLDGPNE